MDWNELPLESRHLGVLSGARKIIFEPMVCLAQNVHLSLSDIKTISKQTKKRFLLTHVTYEFHRVHPKWFSSLWIVRHKPCTYLASRLAMSQNGPTLTISKRNETRFHMTHITEQFYRVRPKWFLSLGYILHKSCTCLAPTLTLSLKGTKLGST
jgi:hypothetical protein